MLLINCFLKYADSMFVILILTLCFCYKVETFTGLNLFKKAIYEVEFSELISNTIFRSKTSSVINKSLC